MGDVHIFLTAEGRLLQGQGQTGPHGAPFGRSCPGLSTPAEPAKAAAEEGAKQVAPVKSAAFFSSSSEAPFLTPRTS